MFRSIKAVRAPSIRLVNSVPAASIRTPLAASYRFYSDKKSETSEAPSEQPEKPEGNAEPTELELLKEKYDAKDKECAKFKEAYQRSIADFRNLQKTTEQDVKRAKEYALQGFAKDLLATVDNFDLALQAAKPEQLETNPELKNFYEGVKMVQNVFEKTLEKNGLIKTSPIDEKFDPKLHEAVFQVAHPEKDHGVIINVQQTGFSYNGRVLRAPKVGVVKKD